MKTPIVVKMAAVVAVAALAGCTDLKPLQAQVDTLLGEDFKTQHASGKFGEGYEELTTGLEQAIEGISDMGEALRGMMQAIQSLDEQMAGS